MNEYNQVEQSEPSQIHFDTQLLNRKKALIEHLLKNEEEAQEELCDYPNQQLKKIASEHLKNHGKLLLCKNMSSLYFGQTCNDLYHGYGLLVYKTATLRFYQGHFQNNCKYGYGLQYINGDIYIGKFLNNKPEDENGIFIWSNGDIYHGSFVNGMKHGIGKWQSGEQFYSGSWKFNKPQGEGYIKSAISEYNGDVKNGYKHGNGIEVFNNGDRYEGMYSNGKPEGIGTYAWANGSIYKGEFKNGLRFGNGVWQYGSEKYEGPYVNDKRNGQGMYTWNGGSYYKGNFVEDLRHGYGQMHWDNSFYKGEWFEGLQQGQGQLWENNKLVEKGFFQNGKVQVQSVQKQNPARIFQGVQQMKKVETQKNTQILPSFEDKRRFNSFHNVKQEQFRVQRQRPEKVFHQSFYQKQNELLLQKKREINKRYSFLDKYPYPQKKESFKFMSQKSHQKSHEKDKSKEKQEHSSNKTSLVKIQLYKKLRKDKAVSPLNKPSTTTSKLPKSFEGPMFQTQLQPIKWKNFAHFSSN